MGLGYIGSDYQKAVEKSQVINKTEFAEMTNLTQTAKEQFEKIKSRISPSEQEEINKLFKSLNTTITGKKENSRPL